MDSNDCDTIHLDGDVRLPPRKRLLAGLKKQSCSEGTSHCSQESNPSPSLSPPISQGPLSEFDVRLNNLLKSYKNGSNMSPEEIAAAAKSAAVAAAKAAQAARVVAEEKAAIAAKAVAAAKSALEMVASASEETSSRDKHLRKNKLKKHVPVQQLYTKYQPLENCGADEELARNLHRAMNSSPRISRHSQGSDSRNHKHKKLKLSSPNEKSSLSNGTGRRDGNLKSPSTCNGDADSRMDCEGSNEESYTAKVDEKVPKSSKSDDVDMDSGDAESSLPNPKERTFEGADDISINGRKRGRIKQKKLPLSICSSKDQSNPKEEPSSSNSLLTRAKPLKPTARHLSLPTAEPSPDNGTPMDVAPTWKCQDFKVPQCMKDKLVQS